MFNDKCRELLKQTIVENNKEVIKELAELINSDEDTVCSAIKTLRESIAKESSKYDLNIKETLDLIIN